MNDEAVGSNLAAGWPRLGTERSFVSGDASKQASPRRPVSLFLLLDWRSLFGRKPARRKRNADRSSAREVQLLEDRTLLSATALANGTLSHQEWRELTFQVDVESTETANTSVLPAVEQDAGISAVQSTSMIGLPQVFSSTSYRGAGYSVAIIDTGIDYNHASLGGGWGNRVIAGYDFVNNDTDPMDDNGHGTHVAGIVGSNHATYTGIAPDVNLIALKVLGANGSGSFGDIEDALQWVVANRETYNIVAVNMSLGAGNYTVDPFTFLDNEFIALENAGVFTAVAAGNSFYTFNSQPGLGVPAISQYVVSVGAVWDANVGGVTFSSGAQDISTAPDRITSFTQRSDALDILAPGAFVTNTYLNGGFATLAGTSMAAPMIAGASVLLREAADDTAQFQYANQDALLALMQSTGVTLIDGDDENDNVTNTGLSFQRIDLFAAMTSLLSTAEPGEPDKVVLTGSVLDVYGTDGDDTFAFTPGTVYTITINGEIFEFNSSAITEVIYRGGLGNDSITIAGTAGNDVVTLEVGSGSLTTTGLKVTIAEIENVVVTSGGGSDTATLRGDAGNDRLSAYVTYSRMTGTNYLHEVQGFARVESHAGAGGDDRASLYDSAGNDTLTAGPTTTRLRGTGFDNLAHGFGNVMAYATQGLDIATFTDSAGYDVFTATPTYARIIGDTFRVQANCFDKATATSSLGGGDRAYLYDSSRNDTLNATPTTARLFGAGFDNTVIDFGRLFAYSTAGGSDRANLSDSAGNDVLTAYPTYVQLSGTGYINYVSEFEMVYVTATNGGTDVASMYDGAGYDVFTATPTYSKIVGDNYLTNASGFDRVTGYSNNGGADRAYLYDSSGNDTFKSTPTTARLWGTGFDNAANNFGRVLAHATAGGNDRANLYDSAGNDYFEAYPTNARLWGSGFSAYVGSFDSVFAYATAGGNDVASFYDSAGYDVYRAYPTYSEMTGTGYRNYASGFDTTSAFSLLGGADRAYLYDSIGNDTYTDYGPSVKLAGSGYTLNANGFSRLFAFASDGLDTANFYGTPANDHFVANGNSARMTGPGYNNDARDFDVVNAISTAGGTDLLDFNSLDAIFSTQGNWVWI